MGEVARISGVGMKVGNPPLALAFGNDEPGKQLAHPALHPLVECHFSRQVVYGLIPSDRPVSRCLLGDLHNDHTHDMDKRFAYHKKIAPIRLMRMVSLMEADKKPENLRNRTIRWSVPVDDLAVRLASENGYYPEKTNGGVSRYLSDLVRRAAITRSRSKEPLRKTS